VALARTHGQTQSLPTHSPFLDFAVLINLWPQAKPATLGRLRDRRCPTVGDPMHAGLKTLQGKRLPSPTLTPSLLPQAAWHATQQSQ
jgi:hypothetical protein